MLTAFFHGWFLCFGLILPLGVQNVFVFTQGAQHRRWAAALPTVMTAGICDSLLIVLAIGGVSVLILKTPAFRYVLGGAGVIFLLCMGAVTWRARPTMPAEHRSPWNARRQTLFAASVSLLNPHAIIDTVAVVGPSSLAYQSPALQAFAGGCILNSWLWFTSLMTVGHLLHALPRADIALHWFNRASAAIMWVCALLLSRTLLLS